MGEDVIAIATDTTLHTSNNVATGIEGLFPDLRVLRVPPEVVPRRRWIDPVKGNGSLGVWTAYVGFMSMPRGSDQKKPVGIVAEGGPADRAGIGVGDLVERNGYLNDALNQGAVGTSVSLKVHQSDSDVSVFDLKTEDLSEQTFQEFALI